MKMDEDFVHVAMRGFLSKHDWLLIAGEYPNGSDDELNVLNIADPKVACDNSPDPRRSSEGEIIPDLVAYKDGVILIIEAKPGYSAKDKAKLTNLMKNEKERLVSSLEKFSCGKALFNNINYKTATYVPVLAYGNPDYTITHTDNGFAHLYIKSLNEAKLIFFGLPIAGEES